MIGIQRRGVVAGLDIGGGGSFELAAARPAAAAQGLRLRGISGMRTMSRAVRLAALVIMGVSRSAAQTLPAADDSRHSMLREAMLGLLTAQAAVPEAEARHHCLSLPVAPPNDRLEGPHGDSLIGTQCVVRLYQALEPPSPGRWFVAQYRWTSLFTAEDSARGPAGRDTVIEDEAVVLATMPSQQVRPVWHARFEAGPSGVWRSITPELAATPGPTRLLSIMSCVNGTGGCGQEFIQRYPDGHWAPVWQVWLDQLPAGYAARLQHGIRIDPSTLRADAGFYGPRDPNCCPSEILRAQLTLAGDSLRLRRHVVVPTPRQ